jgi:3-phenylpropionate/trans-cinnamate dioxygenase ferredoxin reductase subunit
MAQDQGDIAAKNILGAGIAYEGVPWFWSDQFELTLQISGLPDAGSTEIVRTRSDGVDLHFGLDDSRLVAASGIGIGGAVARDIRIAEKMIGRRATPDPAHLADPSVSMKQLLRTSPVREKELRP